MWRNGLSIELRHLRYFIAAAELGSFRKAGAAIGVQESAISRRVRDLEDELGASLFNRHNSGVCLTFAGERFLRRAREIIRSVGDGAEDVASIGRSEQGRIRIGFYSSIASGFLADLLRRFDERHADIRMEFITGEAPEYVVAVRQLRLDVAFVTGTREWPDCDHVHLWSERVFAALSTDHALTQREEVEWRDLADESFIVSDAPPGREIHDYIVRGLANFGGHPSIQMQEVGRDNLVPIVALGRAMTIVSGAMTAARFPGVSYRPIVGEVIPYSAVWSPKNDNPAFRRFLSLARSMARSRQADGVNLPFGTTGPSGAPW